MSAPLLLLHGFGGGPASFASILAELPLGRSCLAPTLLGHGDTIDGAGNNSQSSTAELDRFGASRDPSYFAQEVRRIADLIFQFGRPVHLAGYSLGARIALGVLTRYPELVERATLVSGRMPLRDEAERVARRAHDQKWIALLRTGDLEQFFCQWDAQSLFASKHRASPARLAHEKTVRMKNSAEGLALSLERLGLAEMDPVTPNTRFGAELTIVTGALDIKFQQLAAEFLDAFPSAKHISIPDRGHNLLVEAPEALVEILNE